MFVVLFLRDSIIMNVSSKFWNQLFGFFGIVFRACCSKFLMKRFAMTGLSGLPMATLSISIETIPVEFNL